MRTDLVVEPSTRWKYQIRPPGDRTPRRRRSPPDTGPDHRPQPRFSERDSELDSRPLSASSILKFDIRRYYTWSYTTSKMRPSIERARGRHEAVALKSPPPAPHCARWAATQGLLYFALLRRKWQNFLDMRTCRQRDRAVISARASANRDERGRPFREQPGRAGRDG